MDVSNNGKSLSMDGMSEVFTKIEGVRDFPVLEIAKIQEVLKPLGYMVEGFKSERCSDYGLLLYLTPGGCLPFGKDSTVPLGV
jgi:hypothetical protein